MLPPPKIATIIAQQLVVEAVTEATRRVEALAEVVLTIRAEVAETNRMIIKIVVLRGELGVVIAEEEGAMQWLLPMRISKITDVAEVEDEVEALKILIKMEEEAVVTEAASVEAAAATETTISERSWTKIMHTLQKTH